jgi:Bacterial extracellular solute-binding protein, family 7
MTYRPSSDTSLHGTFVSNVAQIRKPTRRLGHVFKLAGIILASVVCWEIAVAQKGQVAPDATYLAVVGPPSGTELAKRLSDSPAMRKLGLQLTLKRYVDSIDAIKDLRTGRVQIAVFNLDSLVALQEQTGNPLILASALSQPFQFRSDEELTSVLGTSFGEAVLADVSRAGIVPLSLWNQGLSQIVSEKVGIRKNFFVGSHVMTSSSTSLIALKALGAHASLSREGYDDWDKDVDAIETGWNLPPDVSKKISPKTYVAAFRPLIQVVAANRAFSDGLSETQKKAVASEVIALIVTTSRIQIAPRDSAQKEKSIGR